MSSILESTLVHPNAHQSLLISQISPMPQDTLLRPMLTLTPLFTSTRMRMNVLLLALELRSSSTLQLQEALK
jgi:hypothetical protein